MSYRWCIVPLCTNTSIKTPNKIFLNVPKDPTRRINWLKASRRDKKQWPGPKTTLWCCEDHFNMEEDVDNYLRFKLMGGSGSLRTHKSVVPHIFKCQPNRLSTSSQLPRVNKVAAKKEHNRLVSEALNKPSTFTSSDTRNAVLPVLSDNMEVELALQTSPTNNQVNDTGPTNCDAETSNSTHWPTHDAFEPLTTPETPSVREVAVQVNIKPKFRSKATNCTPQDIGFVANKMTSPIKTVTSEAQARATKSLGHLNQPLDVNDVFTDTDTSSEGTETCSLSRPSGTDSDEDFDDHTKDLNCLNIRSQSLSTTRSHCMMHPFKYMGIPSDSVLVIDLLSKRVNFKSKWLKGEDVVMLVLRKIKLNESFSVLADFFGITSCHCAKLFGKYVALIADCMAELIVWPEREIVHRHLPISFQARYSNVQSIIDCFEIEIEKPSKAVNQALTWSDYKKCNTLKYLISATPDGLINFISEGYGGRVSDMVLLEDSQFIDNLLPGMSIMADRGFKHIESMIVAKGCTLVRPPSVSEGVPLDSQSCKETKRIASLRIHIERLIRRLREFKYLTPHACLDIHILGQVDHCVKIAAGLVNLQGPLIK